MSKDMTIGADGIDAAALVERLKKRAKERVAAGEFDEEVISRAERYNLAAIKDSGEFFGRYLSGLRSVVQVDINDWDMVEHRPTPFAPLLLRLKRGIWSLLRFYTFRLWSQQNKTNGLLHSALVLASERVAAENEKLLGRIAELERRVAALEGGACGK